MIARLYRIIPLLILLAVVAGVVYLVVTFRHSPTRAKEVLIRLFTGLLIALSLAFIIIAIYAYFDGNPTVVDLALSFLVTSLIGLGITQLCRMRFKKNHPHYTHKAQKADPIGQFPWDKKD